MKHTDQNLFHSFQTFAGIMYYAGSITCKVKQRTRPLKFWIVLSQTDNAEAPCTVSTSDVQKGRAASMCHISQRTKEGCHFPITLKLPLQSSQYARQKQSITEKQDSYEISLSLCSYCPLTETTERVRHKKPDLLFSLHIIF